MYNVMMRCVVLLFVNTKVKSESSTGLCDFFLAEHLGKVRVLPYQMSFTALPGYFQDFAGAHFGDPRIIQSQGSKHSITSAGLVQKKDFSLLYMLCLSKLNSFIVVLDDSKH
jgi:hypothetical protein